VDALVVANLMADRIRIIPHEAVPLWGASRSASLTGGRLNISVGMTLPGSGCADVVDSATAKRDAKSFATAEQDALDSVK
jgi:hypothetical protein